MKQIPNLFTLLNLVSGFIAIILILQTGETLLTQSEEGSWIARLPESIWWGSVFIGIAALIDFLDGLLARALRAESAMGVQLDSLADVVSFGVAPGLILFQLLRISFIREETGLDTPLWCLAPAVLFPCAGAWRLARFNTSAAPTPYFRGTPIPAAGLVVASLPLILFYDNLYVAPIILNKWILYAVIVILSYLMVSNYRFLALKFSGGRKNISSYLILAAAAIAAALFLQWLAVPLIFVLYAIMPASVKKETK